MSVVAGVKRKDTCSNIERLFNTVQALVQLPSMPLGVVLVPMLMVFEVLNGYY